jgi:hypothetical protein
MSRGGVDQAVPGPAGAFWVGGEPRWIHRRNVFDNPCAPTENAFCAVSLPVELGRQHHFHGLAEELDEMLVR